MGMHTCVQVPTGATRIRYPGTEVTDGSELPIWGATNHIFYKSSIYSQLLSHVPKLASFPLHQAQRANGPCMRLCVFIPAFDT